MEVKLIKAVDNTYVIATELKTPAKEGDWLISKEKVVHSNIGYNFGDSLVLYSTDPLLGLPKLSIKNCEDIVNGYDLDALAYHNSLSYTWLETNERDKELISKYSIEGFKEGFKKALEILGDSETSSSGTSSSETSRKKFSEKEMWNMFYFGDTLKNQIKSGKIENKPMGEIFDDSIQSLQKTEWEAEVEIERHYDGLDEMGQPSFYKKPKLDKNGFLILKRK